MSCAFELMPPAGFVLSESNGFTGTTLPPTGACGVATFAPLVASEWRTLLPVMPTFFRMRDDTKSSHDWPLTLSMTSPAIR